MIPKVIHYCWFGRGELPELAIRCIESWKKHLPEYEIKEWNEDNFNLDLYPYVREAYDNKKYAFVTDVVRLYALYHEGGVYMDTDVEVLHSLDSILIYDAVSGFESSNQIPTGLMACTRHNALFKELLDDYEGKHFVKPDGSLNLTTNVVRITKHLSPYGLKLNNSFQVVHGLTLLPSDYLCPKSTLDGKLYLTNNTLVIHHFAGSWCSPVRKKIRKIILCVGGYRLKNFIKFFLPK